ncbi:hypothetical protein KCM76_00555 [Zooshikella marina]|uniref:hypothetical protein n=1 Tax=Zooshikella ganghwensis TaxID=202772 RepID=UPI001BAFBDA3|nr:hypothetical protein [Zooshikella ganghwensis]MBU2704456.1 hypothetical protein [Zooshikella ganghwensis]
MTESSSNQLKGDESPIDAFEIIFDWQNAWLRAIAIAWNDEIFKKLLVAFPIQALGNIGFSGKGTYRNAHGHCKEFSLWSLLDLKVIEATTVEQQVPITIMPTNGEYKPVINNSKYTENGWERIIHDGGLKMTLILQIPPAPKEYQALAIGDYEAAGKIFPVTGL